MASALRNCSWAVLCHALRPGTTFLVWFMYSSLKASKLAIKGVGGGPPRRWVGGLRLHHPARGTWGVGGWWAGRRLVSSMQQKSR